MNISIDLLPERTRRQEGKLPLIPVFGLASIVAGAMFLTFTYISVNNNVTQLEAQVATKTEELLTLEAGVLATTSGINAFNYVDEFTAMSTLLSSVFKGTISLKDRIYFHLPEGTEVTRYSYENNGDLTVQVTSVSKGDAAVFLNHLLNEREISGAEVTTIELQSESGIIYQSDFTLKLKTLAGEQYE
ncbi:hypothetical protein [Halalkalibacter krulwichiae]|uniref:Fimbrial assembly protein (PilN) n=1 Tax=Halalkalibacter krulwichiae TaxID=199441 RepID=A0A1X9MIW3_9BACI|nr:hypothetical protein [Halalkalibacter krulwichiae]ARK31601.1 hypothetical protein BkAM31D_18085 [Halalkalibacter krulwichiae]